MTETLNYNPECYRTPCLKVDCKKKECCCGLAYVNIPSALTSECAPVKGLYSNAIVEYEGTGEVYIFSKEGVPVKIKEANG